MLLTDDQDIRENYLQTMFGGNGDYYILIKSKDENGIWRKEGVRIAMSGGNAPSRVKLAVCELYRAMEEVGLNEEQD